MTGKVPASFSAAPVRGRASVGAWWSNPRARAVIYQILVIGGFAAFIGFLASNAAHNLDERQIRTGFGYLGEEAGFEIGEGLVGFDATRSYGRAFLVGFLNTIRVAIIGIVLASVLGVILGVGRLSANWLVARLCTIYIEAVRNVPLLLQLFLWYTVISGALPPVREALVLAPGVFLSASGLMYPAPLYDPAWIWAGAALLLTLIGIVPLRCWAVRRQQLRGQPVKWGRIALVMVVCLPLLMLWLSGGQIAFDLPVWQRFGYRGGASLSPEFLALVLGLSLYTAAFIAEIVRGGILAVPKGQSEAARALGLRGGQVLRLVVLPQALRAIIPPLTSQYLNLVKNSSLAVAVGYPDLVSVSNTTLNQTGQAIEAIALFMAVYLLISLGISLFMNFYNRRVALVER